MTDETKLKRAIGYAASLVFMQEVGMGPDENLSKMLEVQTLLQDLCYNETGVELDGYPTQFLHRHRELLKNEKLPMIFKDILIKNEREDEKQ